MATLTTPYEQMGFKGSSSVIGILRGVPYTVPPDER